MKSELNWERKRLQEKMKEFKKGDSFWTHEFEFALEDAEKLDEEENLREAVRKGVRVRIRKIRQGSEGDTFITSEAIKMFGLEEEKVSFEEAVRENCRIKLSKVIEDLKKDWMHVSEYRFHRDQWKKMAEKVPSQLKEKFVRTLLAYRKRHGLIDYERIEKKIKKLATEHNVSVKRWWLEDNKVIIWLDSESGIIAEKVAERYSKKIEYFEYTPEDMAEPLEAYYYITFEGKEEELEKIFKEAGDSRKEIETANEKLKERILKAAEL